MAKQSVAVGGDATQKNGQEVVKKSKFKKKAKGSESTAVPEVHELPVVEDQPSPSEKKKNKKKRKAESINLEATAEGTDDIAQEAGVIPATKKSKKKKQKLSDGQDARTQLIEPTGPSDGPVQKEGLFQKLKRKVKSSLGVEDPPSSQAATDTQTANVPLLAIGSGETKLKKKKKKDKKAAQVPTVAAVSEQHAQGDAISPGSQQETPQQSVAASAAADATMQPATPPGHNGNLESEPSRDSGFDPSTVEAVAVGRTPGSGRAFQRVKSDEWMTAKAARDNSYTGTFGQTGWGARAQEILGQVRGKDFRHEKTKKKRGTYRGGLIESGAVNSFKFDDSD